MSLESKTIMFIDFETTGTLAGYPEEPWQVAWVPVIDGEIDLDHAFTTYLNIQDRPFNPAAPGRHQQLKEELYKAPTCNEIYPSVYNALHEKTLGAHNVATEKKMLRTLAPLHRWGPWVDTLVLARTHWPEAPSHALDQLIPWLGLQSTLKRLCPDRGAHDALYDAIASALCWTTLQSSL